VIRVFLIADSPAARTDWRARLKAYGVNVVGEASAVESVGVQASDSRAEVLLIDAADGNAASAVIETLAEADLASEIPTVVLVDEPGASEVAQALRAGVRALLPREAPAEQIAAALNAATLGLVTLLPEEIAAVAQVSSAARPDLSELTDTLTPREREVLQMLAAGLANKEIATRLNISDHTAKFHVAAILGKLGAATRTEAVTIGIRRGLVLL
jgi:two-component system, NarL family, response regulator YdfI